MRCPTARGFLAGGRRRRGAMLVVALLFLTLLTLLGVTFAALMKLERQAARNFVDTQTAELVLHSAVDAVASQLRGSDNYYHYTSPRAPWLFMDPDPTRRGDLGTGRYLVEEVKEQDLYFHGILEPVKGIARSAYRAIVYDCASQINLNSGVDNLAMVLDSLGRILETSPRIGINPFYSDSPRGGAQRARRILGSEIVRYRRKLEKGRFTSKSQLADIIGQQNFDVLCDFVTVDSWVDPSTTRPADFTELVLRLDNETKPVSSITGLVYQDAGHQPVYGTYNPVIEPRAPVNINTASREVLAALFAGIACRRPFPFVERAAGRIGQEEMRAGYAPKAGDRFPAPARPGEGGSEEINYTIRPVWVYTPRIDLAQARMIAEQVVQERRQKPFVCWEAGQREAGGFHEFVNTRISTSMLPRPTQVAVIEPYMPLNKRFEGAIKAGGGGNPAIQYLWGRGIDTRDRSERRRLGLAVNESNDWFYETVRSAIMANFNPNTRLSRAGYSLGACLPVDKSALLSVWLPDLQLGRQQPSRSEVYVGYTTEFCFDSQGYYEVTALAELDEQYDPSTGLAKPKIFRKARAVVKIFEVAQHTTQYDFERQFRSGAFSSKRGDSNGRDNVMTFPHPMIAVTDYVSSGSRVDGRIELMGELDSLKIKMPPTSRDGFFRGMQTVLFHHDWQYRDSRDESRFISLARRGWERGKAQIEGDLQIMTGVTEFERLLTSVLDGQYAKFGSAWRERYMPWPDRHGSNTVIYAPSSGDEDLVKRTLQWPRLGEQLLDFDNVRPDGLHTSIFNASTRGAGISMFPASQITTGSGWNVGQHGNFSVQGDRGNVDYYQGGVAFWIKFDFDGSDPVFCGLVGCTQVVSDVGVTPKSSEGNQFYIFKSSFGELRVVRMYYHRAFGVPSMHGSHGLLPPPKDPDEAALTGEDEEEEIEKDPNKTFARSEAVVDVSGWKANEWHHVAVAWNDLDTTDRRLRVFVDFQSAEGATGVQYGLMGEQDFVALNTKVPYDELTIGGIIRRQADAQAGLFKFDYNMQTTSSSKGVTSGSGDAGVGGIGRFVFHDLKIFPANATIDEFVSFSGQFENFLGSVVGRVKGYYTTKPGRYHNVFEVTLPHGVEAVRMRSFTWTEYQPPFYHGPLGNLSTATPNRVRATVYLRGIRRVFQRAPWLETSAVAKNAIGGVILRAPTGRGYADEPIEIPYRLDLNAVRGSGRYGGVPIGTPVVDDVTLTYFLPSTQILLWEDLPVNGEALAGRRRGLGSSVRRGSGD